MEDLKLKYSKGDIVNYEGAEYIRKLYKTENVLGEFVRKIIEEKKWWTY